ncbi:MAG: phosphatidate cytidylyltransferase [Oscillospiraceae bacterium]
MKQRIFSAIIGLSLFATILFFFDGIIFHIAIALVSVIAVYEVLVATKYSENKALSAVSLIFAAMVPFFRMPGFNNIAKLASFLFIAALFTVLIIKHDTIKFEHIGLVFFVSLVFPLALSSVIYIRDENPQFGMLYVLLIFVFAWGADGGAYFVGKFFGKHKLAPKISPNKTIEGAIGGLIAGIIFSVLTAYIYSSYMVSTGVSVTINWVLLIIVAAVMSIIGMFGDLSASIIKRQCSIKDFGHILPGHGGVLDRFDSILFVAPTLFILLQFVKLVK